MVLDVREVVAKATKATETLPVQVWMVDWDGIADKAEWTYDAACNLFTMNGFGQYVPKRRSGRTAAKRAMQKVTGAKARSIRDVKDVVAVTTSFRRETYDEVGATADMGVDTRVRLVSRKAVAVPYGLRRDFDPTYAEELEKLTAYDVKKRFKAIVEQSLGGWLRRGGQYFVPNEEPYASLLRMFARLVEAFGGELTKFPIRDEEKLLDHAGALAVPALTKRLEVLDYEVSRLVSERDGGRKVADSTIAKYRAEYTEAKNQAAFFVERFAVQGEKLGPLVAKLDGSIRASLGTLLTGI